MEIGVPVAVSSQPSGALEVDLCCAGCGYNLRGLLPAGLCPECGMAIEYSRLGWYLQFAEPCWVDRVRLGVKMLLLGILVGLISAGLDALLGVLMPQQEMVWSVITSLVSIIFYLFAVYFLTAPEPRVASSEGAMTLRRFLRFVVWCRAIGEVFFMVLEKKLGLGLWMTPAVGADTLLGVAMFFGQNIYLRRFARRIPDLRLAHSTTIMMWGYGLCGLTVVLGAALAVVGMLGSAAGPGLGPNEAVIAGGLVAALASVGVVVFSIWSIVLLFRYNRALRQAAMEAKVLYGRMDHVGNLPVAAPLA